MHQPVKFELLGASLFWQGDFAESLEHLEIGSLASLDLPPVDITGVDITAFALSYQAHCLWQLGFPDETVEMCRRALERADSLNHPFTAANARLNVVRVLLHVNVRSAQQEAETMVAISAKHGF